MIIDTGSSDLWVAGTSCTSSSCRGVTLFNSAQSSTFTVDPTSFDITYGSGEATGSTASDTVTMGGFTVTGQTFGQSYKFQRRLR